MPSNLHELFSELIVDTKGSAGGSFWQWTADSSLAAFSPELILCATIVLMLFVRFFTSNRKFDVVFLLALVGSIIALFLAAPWALHSGVSFTDPSHPSAVARMEIFTGMLVYDAFGVFVRALLIFFLILFVILSKLTGIPDRDDAQDIYTLVFGATLGMCLMATANHLLMVFMAVEMASVPSYVLAGMMKGQKRGSEAALKYSVYGAGAAGVMLYGISLVAGITNTAHLPTMAMKLADMIQHGALGNSEALALIMGGLMIMVGLAFKLSAVPFHFWCPDVFEGATAEVNAFLSVASKAAALALLVRVAIGFGAIPPAGPLPGERTDALKNIKSNSVSSADGGNEIVTAGLLNVADVKPGEDNDTDDAEKHAGPMSRESAMAALSPVRSFVGKLIAFFAIITCTFGNLAAYGQTNIKRLMAYSTIAHAGYMMMPIPVVMVMADIDPTIAEGAIAALCIYMGIYLFMNLGAFATIAFLRNAMRSEEIADYAGLIRRCPGAVVCLSIIMFSLLGMPPLAGFIGKFAIFASLADGWWSSSTAGNAPATYLLVLLVVGGINTAISLFYYLRVVKVMTMDPEPEDRLPFENPNTFQLTYVGLTALATVVLFFGWNWLSEAATAAAHHLLYIS